MIKTNFKNSEQLTPSWCKPVHSTKEQNEFQQGESRFQQGMLARHRKKVSRQRPGSAMPRVFRCTIVVPRPTTLLRLLDSFSEAASGQETTLRPSTSAVLMTMVLEFWRCHNRRIRSMCPRNIFAYFISPARLTIAFRHIF